MIERPQENATPAQLEEVASAGLVPQLRMMLGALWVAPVRNTLLALASTVFLVIAVTAYGQIRLNRWNKPFYDALSHRDLFIILLMAVPLSILAAYRLHIAIEKPGMKVGTRLARPWSERFAKSASALG